MKFAKTGKRRLSLQICRVVAIMQLLSDCNPTDFAIGAARPTHEQLTAGMLHQLLNDLLPKPVCKRTIMRDLDALEHMGFVESFRGEPRAWRGPRGAKWYYLASPAKIRDRLKAGMIVDRRRCV